MGVLKNESFHQYNFFFNFPALPHIQNWLKEIAVVTTAVFYLIISPGGRHTLSLIRGFTLTAT